MPDERREILSHTRALLRQAGQQDQPRFRVIIQTPGMTIRLTPRRSDLYEPPDELPDHLKAILLVADEVKPHKATVLARRCGRKCDSRFRGYLTELVRDGHLQRVGDRGYVHSTPSGTEEDGEEEIAGVEE